MSGISLSNFLFAVASAIEPVLWIGFILSIAVFLTMMWRNEGGPLPIIFAIIALLCGIGVALDKSTYSWKNTLDNSIEFIQKDVPKLVPETLPDLADEVEKKWEDIKRDKGL